MRRDTQRSKVYAAEKEAFADHPEATERFESVEEIEEYVRYVFGLKRVRDAFPNAMPRALFAFASWGYPDVKDGRRRNRAGATVYDIRMPRWSRKKWVVLHELAHTVSLRIDPRIAGHGWEYCATYLKLVRCALGVDAHNLLRDSFRKHRVRFRAPKKRAPLSPERRAALIETLRAAREKRGTSVSASI